MTDRHSALDSCVYITIGGGIGVGLSYKKSPFVGLSHTEGGHFKPRRYVNRVGETDDFEGTCDYHSDCVEGLSNAPSLAKRLGIEVDDLATVEDDHEIWDLFAHYIGELCATVVYMICPEVIVLGGGVMKRRSLFPRIRAKVLESLSGYIRLPRIIDGIDGYIVPAVYDDNTTGVVGSLLIAAEQLQ
ncbi:hypothetical protein MHBO_000203 [Bonamia ostreae]|uniref:fructokinase n=1 Tax=Bonamia ostreae TaxID=126728 RepID=A0ABV2AFH4_9EUKA